MPSPASRAASCSAWRRPAALRPTPGWRPESALPRSSVSPWRISRNVVMRRSGGGPLLFLVARVVGGVDVPDRPRPDAVQLDDRLALDPGEVFHAGRPVAVGAGGHGPPGLLVEGGAHADVEGAGEDRHPLRLGVRVRRD